MIRLQLRKPAMFEIYWLCCAAMGALSVVIVMATGRSGFAVTPFLNAAWAILVFYVSVAMILTSLMRGSLPFAKDAAGMLVCIVLMIAIGLALGLTSANPTQYVISTTIYWLNWVMLLIILPIVAINYDQDRFSSFFWGLLWVSVVLWAIGGSAQNALLLIFLALSSFYFMSGVSYKRSLIYLVPIALTGSSVNRAMLLAALVMFFVAALILRRGIAVGCVLAAAGLSLVYVTYGDLTLIAEPGTNIFRRLNEVKLLASGVSEVEDFVALGQRFYEADLVAQSVSADGWSLVFGRGFGATLDMSAAEDETVKWASLAGAGQVHNIHFLPYSLLFRSGLLGLTFLTIYVLTLIHLIYRGWSQGTKDMPSIVLIVYAAGALANSWPAGNYFLTDFALGGFLALASVRMRRERRVQRDRAMKVGSLTVS